MRLCFYNPHAISNATGQTVLSWLAQLFGTNKNKLRKHVQKYSFLLDILKNKEYDTAIVVDGVGTSLGTVLKDIPLVRNWYPLYQLISFFEIYIWCLLNGLNPFQQRILFNRNKLDSRHDVLLSFAFFAEIFLNGRFIEKSIFSSFGGNKILHATHFYKSTKKVAENVRKTGTTHMVAEADLKKSPYFNTFFGFIKDVYILPHVLRARYVKMTPFKERKNRCLALGTLVIENESEKSNEDYCNFFKINTLHPMRKAIFEHRDQIAAFMDSLISVHNEKRLAITNASSLYRKSNIFKIVYDLFFLPEGKEYHRIDIVKKYNEYTMFVAPEETIGLPSVNAVEGMACGCAFIGLDHPMYADSGMVSGKHYIAYDGTFEGLRSTIEYYQKHPQELEVIAMNGYEFAKKRFSEERVVKDFWQYLEGLTASI